MKIMVTSDWELTEERLPIAEKVIGAMLMEFVLGEYTHFVFCGDMFREFNAATERFAREVIEQIKFKVGKHYTFLLVGNHDRETAEDRLTALFGNAIFSPGSQILNDEGSGTPIAFLPAPDRAAFGAQRGAEGRRQRDAALSEALEAALISLETQIGPENLSHAILFFHAAIGGAELGKQKLPHGLTWEIPAARLQRWGLAIGGHIHKPQVIGANIYFVGGLFSQTHGEKAETFRVLAVEDASPSHVMSTPLPRVLVPIEVELNNKSPEEQQEEGSIVVAAWVNKNGEIERGDGALAGSFFLGRGLIGYLQSKANLDTASDTVNLKIRAKLPPNELDALLDADALREQLNQHFGRDMIVELTICREPQGLHKARLEGDARAMGLDEQFDAWLSTLDAENDPAVVDKAKAFMADLGAESLLTDGKFGYRPLWLKVHNFCQWRDAYIDYATLQGAVSVSGMNKLGKSNLFIKGPLFALYKRTSTAGAVTLDADLRLGETEGYVEHCYKASGKTYLVRRALERGKGGVTCKSELFTTKTGIDGIEAYAETIKALAASDYENAAKHYNSALTPVTEKATDIDRHIEDTVGSRPFFLSTVVGTQGDTGRIINATSADWGNWFVEALGLERFEPYRKSAQQKADGAKMETVKVEERIDELEGQIMCDEEELGDMSPAEAIRDGIEAHEHYIMDSRAGKATAEQRRSELGVEIKVLNDKLAGGPALQEELGAVNNQIAGIAIEDIGSRPMVLAFEGSVEEARGKLDRLQATRGTLDDELQKMRTQHAELGGNISSAGNEQGRLEKKFDELQKQIVDLEAKPVDPPPCRQALHAVGTPMEENCPAWRAYSNGEHIDQLKIEYEETENKARAIAENLVTMKEQREQFAASIETRKAELDSMAGQITELSKRLGNYENAEKAIELWDAKAARVAMETVRENELKKKRDELQEKIKALVQYVKDRAALEGEMPGLLQTIREATESIEGHERTIRELNRSLDQIKALRESIEKKRAKQKEYRASISEQIVNAQAWGLLALAFHRTGIPYLLLEQTVEAFERKANEILSPADMSITVQTVTTTQKGDARDKFNVLFNDERGQHPLPKASGMQEQPLVMGIRTGLAIVGCHFYGNAPELYMQDEGFGAFHHTMYDVAREMIAGIADEFRCFVYITHVPDLAESADVQLKIIGVNGTSKVLGLPNGAEAESEVA